MTRILALLLALMPAVLRASPIRLDILSDRTLNGVAGDYVSVQAQIRNTGAQPVSCITTYLSLVDTAGKMPVDLEDWSAEKGLFIGTIEPGQTFPLNWRIHFVKAGGYALIVVAETAGQESPDVSQVVHFRVSPKHSLDPGHVLPVALGTPIILVFILLLLAYRRRVED